MAQMNKFRFFNDKINDSNFDFVNNFLNFL